MKIWLTQRAEPTPHDSGEQRRPMRTGLMADYLSSKGDDVLWWTGDYDHYGQYQRGHDGAEKAVSCSYRIRYLAAQGYEKTISLARLRYDREIALSFTKNAAKSPYPDAILASMPSVDLALASVRFGQEHGIPVVVDIRDLHPDVFRETAPKFLSPFIYAATRPMAAKVSRLCQGATAIWGNSDRFVEWGCRMAGRSRAPQDLALPIAYKPLNVEPDRTRQIVKEWRKAGLFLEKDINIVFFGSLSKSFDFTPVFEAAQKLEAAGSKCRFYFFGAGAQDAHVTTRCEALSNCHYFGPVGAARLQAAMSLSDIGLAPYILSANYTQNMPNKPTEYLGGGLSVALGIKEGILAEFLQRTASGFLYATGPELADTLSQLEGNPGGLAQMRAAARTAFDKYLSYETLSEQMRNGLQSVISNYKTPDQR